MDICHEQGSNRIEFVERDPFLFAFNRLKGWCAGHQVDHLTSLPTLDHETFDLIWIKGSLSAEEFNRRSLRSRRPGHRLNKWLDQVLALGRPGSTIVLCPHWANKNGKRKTRRVEDSLLARTILNKGFSILPLIALHNVEPEYPITFVKRLS